VVLVTSSVPEEGKTSVAAGLGRTAALSGLRVLVLDGDLRRSTLHAAFGVDNARGLAELLAGKAELADVIRQDPMTEARLVTAGHAMTNLSVLLRSERLAALLAELRGSFDLVLIDSPPLLPVTDARLLAEHADGCLLLVRCLETHRKSVAESLRQLRASGGKLLGLVVNRVPERSLPAHRYGGYGYG
jgi:capsular exopolysaccharide synthesis family protein